MSEGAGAGPLGMSAALMGLRAWGAQGVAWVGGRLHLYLRVLRSLHKALAAPMIIPLIFTSGLILLK